MIIYHANKINICQHLISNLVFRHEILLFFLQECKKKFNAILYPFLFINIFYILLHIYNICVFVCVCAVFAFMFVCVGWSYHDKIYLLILEFSLMIDITLDINKYSDRSMEVKFPALLVGNYDTRTTQSTNQSTY